MKKLLAGALIALLGLNASAVTVMGFVSCGTWVDYKEKNNKVGIIAAERWLTGYLSGFSVAQDIDVLVDADLKSLSLWMDNYCRANPLDSISDGGLALFLELAKKKGPTKPQKP